VTPASIRVRKKYLDANVRNLMSKKKMDATEDAAR
jgi:predicted membrane GTPase involved in stress response